MGRLLLFGTVPAQPDEDGVAGVDAEIVFRFQMCVQLMEVRALQMLNLPAGFAAQQETVLVLSAVGAELIAGAVSGADLVDASGLLQPLQLAVDGGEAHGLSGLVEVLGQLSGGQRFLGPLLQAVEHGLLLFGDVRHAVISNLKMIIILTL